jgi:hypothetical protein
VSFTFFSIPDTTRYGIAKIGLISGIPETYFFMLLTRLFFSFVIGFVFSFSFSFSDHLNVMTFLGASTISFPVAGFLPRRFFLFFTRNLPKPEIITSLPDSRVDLMEKKGAKKKGSDLWI